MENHDGISYKIEVRDRLKLFALNILKLSEMIPKTTRGKVINNQLTKSGTSLYANFRAALRGRSKTEFFSKLSITVEEADETGLWLDLLICSDFWIKNLHKSDIQKLLNFFIKGFDANRTPFYYVYDVFLQRWAKLLI